MERIAELIKECIIDNKLIKEKEKRQILNRLCLFTYGSLNAVVLVRGHSPF